MSFGSSVEDYLKLIYRLSQNDVRVMLAEVANEMGVSAPAVTKMVKRLKEMKLVSYDRKNGVMLTRAGEKTALEVLRHHRLIELFLHTHLGYGWDEVHEEADKLEHVISERFENKIAQMMGHPTHDPHGDPIPTLDGTIPEEKEVALSEISAGITGEVSRVSNYDSGMLRYMGEIGIHIGTEVKLKEIDPYGGTLRIEISGEEKIIGRELARHIFLPEQEVTK